MAGWSDYTNQNIANYYSGSRPLPALPSIWLALFTTPPTSDAGTGGVEVSGTAYARQQIAGPLTAASTISTGSPNITMPTNPGWVVPGMQVFDTTNAPANGFIGTVLTYIGTALVLTANAAHAGTGATDTLTFSAFAPATASTGNPEPNTLPGGITNSNAVVTFAQAGAGGWGTVAGFAAFDAVTSGNMLWWDYLGNFKWIPFSCSSGTPGVLTTDANADVPANGSICAVTQKYGGTLPTTAGSWAYPLTSAGSSTNTFNLGVNTTSVGGGLFRQVTQQPIAANVTPSFSTSQLTLTDA